MAVLLSPVGGVAAQFFTSSGVPLSGGFIYTYAAGTSTPQACYTTSSGLIQQSNPIQLDGAGRVPSGEIWLTANESYKFVLQDANNVLIGTYDNIVGINSNYVAFTNQQEIQTATAGQTVFTLTTMQYQPGTNSLSVFVDGVNQYGPGAQYAYVETDSSTITFEQGLHVGASVKFTSSQLNNTSSQNDATQISYEPPFTNSVSESVAAKLAQTVSVKDFGAVGDGVTDDTAEIQAAINYVCGVGYGCVYFPAGTYKVSGTITINSGNVSIAGDGPGATFLYPEGDYGDVLHFTTGTSGTYLQRNSIRDIAFYSQSETTFGATVHFERCRLVHMTDVDISAHFGGLWLDSVIHGYYANVNLASDAAFTSYKANSFLLKLSQNASGALSAENHFVNCDWRGQNGNNYLDYCILINEVDGVSFSNIHLGFCETAGVGFVPSTNSSQLTNVLMSNCTFDTIDKYGILGLQPSTSYTGLNGGHAFNNGWCYNCEIGIAWNMRTTDPTLFANMSIFDVDTHAVQVNYGQYLNFNNIEAFNINTSNTTGYGFDIVGSNCYYIDLNDIKVSKYTGNAPTAGVYLGSGCADITISSPVFRGCTNDILNANASNTRSSVNGMWTDNSISNVSANGSGSVYFPWGQNVLYLTTANNVGQVNTLSNAMGRTVTLIALGSVQVFDTNNLIIAGTWTATVNDTLSLVCDGTNWIETSRSNNT